MKELTTITLDTDFGNYDIEVELDIDVELNYGADADGNRGVERTEINDYEIISISNGDVDLWPRLSAKTKANLYDYVEGKLWEVIQKYLI